LQLLKRQRHDERDINGIISVLNAQQTSLASNVIAISELGYGSNEPAPSAQATMDANSDKK